jgi:CDP-6-deoxy-D-xylo-4-hexulose-3-dehydrase
MQNNITKSDIDVVIKFLKTKPILTQSKKVEKFEKNWSKWLGVKYSIFVNSGSSANLLTLLAIKIKYGIGEIIVPSLTWVSDIASVIQNNFYPVFVDVDPRTLSMLEDDIFRKINKNTKAVFITHAQGFNGFSNKLLKYLKKKKIILIEDVCESHGATFNNKKLGTFGLLSNFSFYYAHHLSTIEGGMICTNSKEMYGLLRMLRSHGLLRENNNIYFKNRIIKKYPFLHPNFIFMYPAYNMRNNEISAVIGINQLKKIDQNNKIRSENLKIFLNNLNNKYFRKEYNLLGNSNYAFPLVLKKKIFYNRKLLEKTMIKNNIEFRRGNAGGGNQLRQPYLKDFIKKNKIDFDDFKEVDHIHFFGY